ncbi:MAG: putative metal-binding motif-containing protein [Myxococcota bacterium]
MRINITLILLGLAVGCGGTATGTDPSSPVDADRDGYSTVADCDDSDAASYPGATEVCGDGVDQDCDGADAACPSCGDAVVASSGCLCAGALHTDGTCCTDVWHDGGYCCTATWQASVCVSCTDGDSDGHHDAVCGGDDCNDALASVHPTASEVCGDSIDQDCSGADLACPVDNRASLIAADMGTHEATLLNAPVGPAWTVRGVVDMGVPRGDATAWFFQPANQDLKSSAYWNALAAWFQIWPGTLHTATNVRVRISAINAYVLSKSTGTWVEICSGSPTWARNQPTGTANVRTEPDGTLSYKLDSSFAPLHGGLAKYAITGSDVAAAYGEVTTELILDDAAGIDDRDQAQLLVQMGIDYYPATDSQVSDFSPMGYAPGSGSGRFGLVSSTPRKHYFVNIDPPGNTNSPKSVFEQNGGVVAIPRAQLEANMPPAL